MAQPHVDQKPVFEVRGFDFQARMRQKRLNTHLARKSVSNVEDVYLRDYVRIAPKDDMLLL